MLTDKIDKVKALEWHRGKIWAASYGKGLFIWDGDSWQMKDASDEFVTCLSSEGERLWYGTWMNGEIGYLESQRSSVVKVPLPRLITPRFAYRVTKILSSRSSVWLGTDGYLLRYDVETGDWSHLISVNGTVEVLARSSQGLWLSTGIDVYRVKDDSGSFSLTAVSAFRGMSVSALVSVNETLWVGAVQKAQSLLGKYRVKDGHVQWSKIPSRQPVGAILVSGEYVFAGLEGGGLWRYHQRTRNWERIKTQRVRSICSLAKAGQSLIVGGEEGIEVVSF